MSHFLAGSLIHLMNNELIIITNTNADTFDVWRRMRNQSALFVFPYDHFKIVHITNNLISRAYGCYFLSSIKNMMSYSGRTMNSVVIWPGQLVVSY